MSLSNHYIVQLCFECWIGNMGKTNKLEDAKRFSSKKQAETALKNVRKCQDFPNAFVDKLRATII